MPIPMLSPALGIKQLSPCLMRLKLGSEIMADPLAIALGIAGLLSLGIQATQSLVSFYTAYKDQDTDLAKITQNLNSL